MHKLMVQEAPKNHLPQTHSKKQLQLLRLASTIYPCGDGRVHNKKDHLTHGL